MFLILYLKTESYLTELCHAMQYYIIKFCPTTNSIFFDGPIHNFEKLRVKHCSNPEVLYENNFLENFTKFTLF